MDNDKVINDYFEWLYSQVCDKEYTKITYRRLLMQLHDTEFVWVIPMDENRAQDGINLRREFFFDNHHVWHPYMDEPCSVLEMMVALSSRCEDSIMTDLEMGDRTGQWFWEMVVSLGLGRMSDDNYDRMYVARRLDIFLNRDYEPNGKGGLFTVDDYHKDMRDVEIWYQMYAHLSTIFD